jgi:hypothetical protein
MALNIWLLLVVVEVVTLMEILMVVVAVRVAISQQVDLY